MLGVLNYLRVVSVGNHFLWIKDIEQMFSGRFYTTG
jgi:hypothetical protein